MEEFSYITFVLGLGIILFIIISQLLMVWYLIYDSKKRNENTVLWGVLGGISIFFAFLSFWTGSLGTNPLVLSIYFFKTKRVIPAVIWLVVFLIPVLIFIYMIIHIIIYGP